MGLIMDFFVKNASVRLFENNFLEACTHVHPVVPALFWTPLLLFCLGSHFFFNDSLWIFFLRFFLGLVLWSMFEYVFHRFVFHAKPSKSGLQRLVFLAHGVHHHEPMDKTRLLMPPLPALLILTTLSAPLFALHIHWSTLYAFYAGFTLGYLCYDYTHYFVHHGRFTNRFYQKVRKHHMNHHFKNSSRNFGVFSCWWDYIFRTHHDN